MPPRVEPIDGDNLERFITALLNVTGIVHRVVDAADRRVDEAADGEAVTGAAAEELRSMFACLAEHTSDEDLALVTEVLADATLLGAAELGLSGLYFD